MRNKSLNIRFIELLIFVIVWMVIYSIPFFNNRIFNIVNWGKVFGEWIKITAFLIIFVLNIIVLVPKFLFQKKYLFYFLFTFLVIVLVNSLGLLLEHFIAPPQPLAMPPMDLGPGMPPMELGSGMPPPVGFSPGTPPEQKSIYMAVADNMIISLLIVGAGSAIRMATQWLNEESKRKDLEKEQLKTELAMLRHQVSPHFFMNTLNNIHALIDINTDDAKNTIIQLSTMMRYLLYDTAHGQTTLKKEIEFIESYINLMKLRYPKNVAVTFEVPDQISDVHIAPMLFISLLENAFKHGVSYKARSFVSFKMELADNRLNCMIKNSKHKSNESIEKSYSGIGLVNIRKSLNLLYGNDFNLDIQDKDHTFEVILNIPVYEN